MIPTRRRGQKAAGIALLTTAFLIALPAVALADDLAPAGVSDETQFILNTELPPKSWRVGLGCVG